MPSEVYGGHTPTKLHSFKSWGGHWEKIVTSNSKIVGLPLCVTQPLISPEWHRHISICVTRFGSNLYKKMYTQDVWETKKGDTSWLQDSKVFSSKDCACQNTFSWRRERQKKIGNEFAVKLDSLRQREFAKKRGPYNHPIWIGTKHSVHKCCTHARLWGYHCHGIAIAFVHNLQFFSDLRVVAKETFFTRVDLDWIQQQQKLQ